MQKKFQIVILRAMERLYLYILLGVGGGGLQFYAFMSWVSLMNKE